MQREVQSVILMICIFFRPRKNKHTFLLSRFFFLNKKEKMKSVHHFKNGILLHNPYQMCRLIIKLNFWKYHFQLSENSSLMSAEDTVSERVRFDDNISFIDDSMGGDDQTVNTGGGISVSDNVSLSGRLLKVSN